MIYSQRPMVANILIDNNYPMPNPFGEAMGEASSPNAVQGVAKKEKDPTSGRRRKPKGRPRIDLGSKPAIHQ
jgi:hypothetical protein